MYRCRDSYVGLSFLDNWIDGRHDGTFCCIARQNSGIETHFLPPGLPCYGRFCIIIWHVVSVIHDTS